jgi:Sec-independent protein secretion pathway component TatC
MVDPADAIGKAREAVTQRAELPGMSLMEHLDELRKRIVRSAIYLAWASSWPTSSTKALRFCAGSAGSSAHQAESTRTRWTP